MIAPVPDPVPPSETAFEGDAPGASEQAAGAAAAPAVRAESPGALADDTRAALYRLLVSLADNKYVLGRRYAEWCTGAPMLESAVAAAAMAQDELGHARSFYPLLRGFPEATAADTMEERGWQTRPTVALACLDAPFRDWSDFVAANFVLDAALCVLFEAALDCSYEPLRQRAAKIIQEEQAHRAHAEGWVRRLAGEPRSRAALVGCLDAVWDHAFTWFGAADDSLLATLRAAGLLNVGADALRARLRARLARVPEVADLVEERCSRPLPWDRWDERQRRLRPAR